MEIKGGKVIIDEILGDFRAVEAVESAILTRLRGFVARHGKAALSGEVAGETGEICGHITVSAWIVNAQTKILLVFSRKAEVWQLPGAHSSHPVQTVREEATRALGQANHSLPALWALAEREIPEYWNTPAHRHFELIFRFEETEHPNLPSGARWFSVDEIAQLNDATLSRLLQKEQER